jgi:phosphomannomutase
VVVSVTLMVAARSKNPVTPVNDGEVTVADQLLIGVSGVRGIVGQTLDVCTAVRFAAAFGTWLRGGLVVVGRDSRPHGEMLSHGVIAGLLETGCRVLWAGALATPSCGVLVQTLGASGGVMITASHNPPEWNGLKFFHRTGRVLPPSAGDEVRDVYAQGLFQRAPWDQVGPVETLTDPHGEHLRRILQHVDVPLIRSRRFRVVLDANHGVGALLGQKLLESLGCQVRILGAEPTGQFAHPPEPLPEHLFALAQAVREDHADVGFAQDPDADRLVLVDEQGNVCSEELTLALCADHLLSHRFGPVVINLSTSRATEWAGRRRNCPVLRAPVGEAHVVEMALATEAVLAGEGNGGVIYPDVVWVRDSFTGMALVLEAMASTGVPLSQLLKTLPCFSMLKEKVPLPREAVVRKLERLRTRYRDAYADVSDGLRLEWADRWVHIRPSNTEPVARIVVEAEEAATARSLLEEIRAALVSQEP